MLLNDESKIQSPFDVLYRFHTGRLFMTRLTDTVYLLHHGRKKMCFKVPVASLHYSVDSTIVAT